jgi:hypothetical protein
MSYSSVMSKQDHEEEWNTSSSLNLGFGGTYFVAKSIGIEEIFYYNRYDLKSHTHSVQSSFLFKFGFQFYLGKEVSEKE